MRHVIYRFPKTRSLRLFMVGMIGFIQACVTHHVACPSAEQTCRTHQALVVSSMDRLLSEGPVERDTVSNLLSPLLAARGFRPMEQSGWQKTSAQAGTNPVSRFSISVPDENTSCFRNALPHWLTWLNQISEVVEAPITLTIHEGSAVPTATLAVTCSAKPEHLIIETDGSETGEAFDAWLGALEATPPSSITLEFRKRVEAN